MTKPNAPVLQSGYLTVSGGHRPYWETAGRQDGKPALVLHGGPGSGCRPEHQFLFDLEAYYVVIFDQRGCGRSRPLAAETLDALENNTTCDLLADIEALRIHLGVESWLVLGGSWGSTLALLYAQTYPERVTELVLGGVTTTSRQDLHWLYGDVGNLFPEAFEAFCAATPDASTVWDRIATYAELMRAPASEDCQRAADQWCRWELAILGQNLEALQGSRWVDKSFRLTFARIVTHYFSNFAWLEDTQLLNNMARISHIPSVMVHSRFDPTAPLRAPWQLAKAWPAADLEVLPETDHSLLAQRMSSRIRSATDRFRS